MGFVDRLHTRGFKTAMMDPDMGTWTYPSYNAYGELLTQTDAKGQSIQMAYDALGRMVSRTDHNEGTTTWVYGTSSAARNIGKLAYVTAPNGYREDYSYDTYGRLERVKRTMDGEYYYVDQTYDSYGRVDVVKYPGSVSGDGSGNPEADVNRLRVRNNYNAYGYLMSVQDVADATLYWKANSVDESGRVTEEKLGNGLYTQRGFDRSTGYLRTIKTGTSAGGTTIQDLAMNYDRAGNLTLRRDLGPNVNGGSGLREEFQYDGLYRLTNASRYNAGSGGSLTASDGYTYDDFGNLLAKGTSYSSYAYSVSRPHAVQSVATSSGTRIYTYDANGNVSSASGGGNRYGNVEWTAANLARKVWKADQYTEFSYGPDRGRYKQYLYRSASDTETTYYVGGLMEKLTRVNGNSTTVEHTHYVRAGESVIALVKRQKVDGSTPTGLFAKYPHRDHLGSIVAVSDAGGALLERSGFDPWGKRVDYSSWAPPAPGTFSQGGSGSGGTANAITSTTRGFTGHEQVEEFGFIHMNGRIYDPEIGRFFSADPTMQFPQSTQGFNRYAYAGNNPLTNVDPSGFAFWKKALSFVGTIMSFIPVLAPYALLINAAIGYLTTGSIAGAAMAVAGSVVGAGYGKLLGGLATKLGAAAGFISGVLSNTTMALMQGAKFGAALRGSIRGGIEGMFTQPAAQGIGESIGRATSAGTNRPSMSGVLSDSTEKADNAASSATFDAVCKGSSEVPAGDSWDLQQVNENWKDKITATEDPDGTRVIRGRLTVSGADAGYIAGEVNAVWKGAEGTYEGIRYRSELSLSVVESDGDWQSVRMSPERWKSLNSGLCPGLAVGAKNSFGSPILEIPPKFALYSENHTIGHEFGHALGFAHAPKRSGSILSYDQGRRVLGRDLSNVWQAYR